MNPADEKAVAEEFPCECDFEYQREAGVEPRHWRGCLTNMHGYARSLAARLRAQHEADKAALVALLGEAREILDHDYACSVEVDDRCDCSSGELLTRIDAALKEKA